MCIMTLDSSRVPAMHSLGTCQMFIKCLWDWIDNFRTDSMNQMNAKHVRGRTIREEP